MIFPWSTCYRRVKPYQTKLEDWMLYIYCSMCTLAWWICNMRYNLHDIIFTEAISGRVLDDAHPLPVHWWPLSLAQPAIVESYDCTTKSQAIIQHQKRRKSCKLAVRQTLQKCTILPIIFVRIFTPLLRVFMPLSPISVTVYYFPRFCKFVHFQGQNVDWLLHLAKNVRLSV